MQVEMTQPQRLLGRGNPKQLGPQFVELFLCPGKRWLLADYVNAFGSTLEAHEEALVRKHADELVRVVVPDELACCLARSPEVALDNTPVLIVQRSGGRSAYWPERRLKFKGCRPVLDGASYPLEVLRADARRIDHETIPFGTISPEGVMRELLGWAFCREHGLPIHARPVCIYEYFSDRRSLGCCLVTETRGEDRIEAHIEYPACTVEEIIRAKAERLTAISGTPIGAELRLRDVNLWWYVEAKSRLLCDMHFHGGFRGVLNSNIGNDVLVRNNHGGLELCLCDFDTFRVTQIPHHTDKRFLEEFTLRAVIETVKGSLSICDYVDIPNKASLHEIVKILGRVYFEKSSLWRAYAQRFTRAAKASDWKAKAVQDAFGIAFRTEAVADVLASCVVNGHYLRQMCANRVVFYPHN